MNYFDEYNDINGIKIQIGDYVLDWCTGIEDVYTGPFFIESTEQLDNMYVNSWGMLEVIDEGEFQMKELITNISEHRKWPKTKRFLDIEMIITQKLDGSNTQILFEDVGAPINNFIFYAGSRNKWLSEDKDNFGFFNWVHENQTDLYAVLGEGRHYGEWVGPKIQNSEGLDERKFYSFNPFLEVPADKKHLIEPVPLLYHGPVDMTQIYTTLKLLEKEGSQINGFHPVEGIIVNLAGTRYKIYLDQAEEFNNRFIGV